jgi:FkbM family methyltransferase
MDAVEPVADLQAVEGDFYRLLARQIPTRVLVDVGAHHGTAFRPFLEAGWIVHAFEPVEANRKRLEENFPNHARLSVHREAVSSENGSATLHLAVHPDGTPHDYYHSLERIGDDPWHRKGKDVTVPVVSLGAMVDGNELPAEVGFLKIDTEGHDLAVLRGLGSLACEVIGVEFWCEGHALGRSPSPPDEMVRVLVERGYPFYLALRHRGAVTDVVRSTLDGIGGADWGNLIFFRADQSELYELVAAKLIQQESSGATAKPAGRLWNLLRAAYPDRASLGFVDVGAYRGDFTADMLAWFPESRGLVFEPSPDSCTAIRERFATANNVEILGTALSSKPGTAPFYRAGPAYNNSLLPPTQGNATTLVATVDTLDNALASAGWNGKAIDLLKIDAQGHDLHILRGATNTIRTHQPAVLVEIIFANLYTGQDSYFDIFQHMKEMGYQLTALLQTHAARGGADAFADALFLPPRLHARVAESGQDYVCLDADHLRSQNEMLQKACDERLQLIHQLNEVAAQRLQVIHSLQQQQQPRRRSLKRWLSWVR